MNVYLKESSLSSNTSDPKQIHVHVYRTNIRHEEDLKMIEPIIKECPFIIRWSVDREDVDCVLRVESAHPDAGQVIEYISSAGYFCEELMD